jgi:hypothetical protein
MFGFDPLAWVSNFWLVKLILSSGTVIIALCLIAALWFGKPFVDGLMKVLTPIGVALAGLFATVTDWLKDVFFNNPDGSVKDIFDNWRTMVTVALLAFVAFQLASIKYKVRPPEPPSVAACKPVIDELRTKYRFVPR